MKKTSSSGVYQGSLIVLTAGAFVMIVMLVNYMALLCMNK